MTVDSSNLLTYLGFSELYRMRGRMIIDGMTMGAKALPVSHLAGVIVQDPQIEAALVKISSIDFTMLKTKIARDENMTIEEIDDIEDLYRKFLALNMRYKGKKICPTGPIDLMWHYHILDTRAYERDCISLFGELLHHFPYFGMRGEQDRKDLEATFAESVELFVRHFGIDPTHNDTVARSCAVQNCP